MLDKKGQGKMGNKLRAYMKAQGLSQRQLAFSLGISPVALGRYVNGTRVPRRRIALAIAAKTGIPVAELMFSAKELRAHQ